MQSPDPKTLELHQEHIEVGKREIETGRVRIAKRVIVHEEIVDVPLLQQAVEITRVPIDRNIEAPVGTRVEGDVTIVPVVEEVLVVTKQLVLREELHVRRRSMQLHSPQTVTLRCEALEVSRLGATEPAEAPPGSPP